MSKNLTLQDLINEYAVQASKCESIGASLQANYGDVQTIEKFYRRAELADCLHHLFSMIEQRNKYTYMTDDEWFQNSTEGYEDEWFSPFQ